ncbi:MAG: VOC family protein [Proteobacteria bacterium]|nr:VOC family protein [Burkholderiales bacterium]
MSAERYDVGGVWLERPFRIRRLGHFGYNVDDIAACLGFYCDGLGLRISDPQDLAQGHPRRDELKALGDTNLYFIRHGTDHHSFVLFDRRVFNALGRAATLPSKVDLNQLTWQVGSLAEVSSAIDYFGAHGIAVNRVGRDMPGSNWHVYPFDPEGHRNELYYGIEQIGWFGSAKPRAMHERGFRERPALPQIGELAEVERMLAQAIDPASGFRHPETLPATFDVDGVLLSRPFKVVRHGPLRLLCDDVESMTRFYTERMGLRVSETVVWRSHRCVFLRCNTEHHSLALYPAAVRDELGWPGASTVMSFGMQVANYRQLRAAIAWLRDRGGRLVELPAELSPGIEWSACVLDPAGHGVELYFSMEQLGGDGPACPRAAFQRPPIDAWPSHLDARPDMFTGETFLGPWG